MLENKLTTLRFFLVALTIAFPTAVTRAQTVAPQFAPAAQPQYGTPASTVTPGMPTYGSPYTPNNSVLPPGTSPATSGQLPAGYGAPGMAPPTGYSNGGLVQPGRPGPGGMPTMAAPGTQIPAGQGFATGPAAQPLGMNAPYPVGNSAPQMGAAETYPPQNYAQPGAPYGQPPRGYANQNGGGVPNPGYSPSGPMPNGGYGQTSPQFNNQFQTADPQRLNPQNIPTQQADANQQPQYRVAVTPTPGGPIDPAAVPPAEAAPQGAAAAPAAEHPLMPALRWAREGLPHVQAIADYSCIVHKRERVEGVLGEHQAMFCKVRHKPFSVYMYFLSPPNLKGQEVLFVEGQNNGNLHAHSTGVKGIVGTVSLDPRGHMAMRNNRYPITELGVQNLIQRLIEVGEHDANYGECDVQFLKAKISNRPCTCIQVVHPTARRNFRFHIAQIFVDDEMNLPIRFASYDWPARQGGEPQLLEEYTYQNVKLNNGFTDADFDTQNPKYGFR